MKKLSTLQLVPGMIVAESVLSYDHQLILSKGTILTDKLITKLDLYGVLFINIENSQPAVPVDPDTSKEVTRPADLTYSDRIKLSPSFQQFKKDYELNVESFKTVVNDVVERNSKLDVNALLHDCLDIITSDKGQFSIMDMLHNMREYDDSTFTHCLNVALIANVFGTWLKWGPEEIELATMCGLLHDIGKLLVPHAIITKPGKLSAEEYAQIKKHPISGYQLLLEQDVNEHVLYSALMHHERCDGTGYPMRLVGKQIDQYARIIAIADVYDAMTAARVYRGPLCPFRVIEIFETEGFQKYDVEYLLIFLEHVVNSYIQNQCRLSDGREGTIIAVNKDKLSKPFVIVEGQYINLADYENLTITELL